MEFEKDDAKDLFNAKLVSQRKEEEDSEEESCAR